MPVKLNDLMSSTLLSNEISRKSMEWANYTTRTRGVCFHYDLSKADDAVALVSTQVRNDVKLYQLRTLCAVEEDKLSTWLKINWWFHLRLRLAFTWIILGDHRGDHGVTDLVLRRLYFLPLTSSTTELHPNAQIWEEGHTTIKFLRKRYCSLTPVLPVLHLSSTYTTWPQRFPRSEISPHDIVQLMIGAQPHPFPFGITISIQAHLHCRTCVHGNPLLVTIFEAVDRYSTPTCVTGRQRQLQYSRNPSSNKTCNEKPHCTF